MRTILAHPQPAHPFRHALARLSALRRPHAQTALASATASRVLVIVSSLIVVVHAVVILMNPAAHPPRTSTSLALRAAKVSSSATRWTKHRRSSQQHSITGSEHSPGFGRRQNPNGPNSMGPDLYNITCPLWHR